MKVNSVRNTSFRATLGWGCEDLAMRMIKSEKTKKYVDKIMKKANNLFPGSDFFISYCGYGEKTHFGTMVDLTVIKSGKKRSGDMIYNAEYEINKKNEIKKFIDALKTIRKQDFTKQRFYCDTSYNPAPFKIPYL